MNRDEVYMEVDAVRNMARLFESISQILKGVAMALQALMMVLKTTAFVGMVGGLAVERYIAQIKPQIDNLSQKCSELGNDLGASATAFENGDQAGSTRFY